MATTVDVLARLKADTSNFTAGMASATASARAFTDANGRLRDSLTGRYVAAAKGAGGATADLGKSQQATKASTVALGSAIGIVASMAGITLVQGLSSAASAGLKAASDLQQAQVAFTTLLGSAKEADTFLNDMREFAAATPFELPGLLSASRSLLAMGFAADDVMPTLTAIGDAAAGLGLGSEGIDRITRALGQMQAKGKVSAEELLQMSEAGVPALRILADQFGVSTGQMQDMISAGQVLSDQAIPALVDGLTNGTKSVAGFGGMMEAQSKTLSGVFSTLKDEARNALVDGIMPSIDPLSLALQGLIPAIEAVSGAFGQGLGPAITQIAETIGPVLTTAFQNLAPALTTIIQSLAPVVTGLVTLLAEVLSGLLQILSPIIAAIGPIIGELLTMISGLVEPLAAVLIPIAQQIAFAFTTLAPVLMAVFDALMPVVQLLSAGLVQVLTTILPVLQQFGTALSTFVTQVVQALAPYLQELIGAFVMLVVSVLPPLVDIFNALLQAFLPLLPVIVDLIKIGAQVGTVFAQIARVMAPLVATGLRLLASVFVPLIRALQPLIGIGLRLIRDFLVPMTPLLVKTAQQFAALGAAGVRAVAFMIGAFRDLTKVVFQSFQDILDAADRGLSWIPGIGPKIAAAASSFASFAASTTSNLSAVQSGLIGIAGQLDVLSQGAYVPVTIGVKTQIVQDHADYRDAGVRSYMREQAASVASGITPPNFSGTFGGGGGAGGGGGGGGGSAATDNQPDWKAISQSIVDARKVVSKGLSGLSKAMRGDAKEVKAYVGQLMRDASAAYQAAAKAIKDKGDRKRLLAEGQKLQKELAAMQKRLTTNAQRRDELQRQIAIAREALDAARDERKAAADSLKELFREPFGEASQFKKAYDATKVTVDGVIDMYDRLVDVVKARYALLEDANGKLIEGLSQGDDIRTRDNLLDFLRDSTTKLIAAIKKRDAALEELEKQRQFTTALVNGINNAAMDLSGLNNAALIGKDAVVERLQDRVTALKKYAEDIKALRTKGVDAEMLQKIVEAGPGQNASLIQALLASTPEDIAAINAAQEEIRKLGADQTTSYLSGFQEKYDAAVSEVETLAKGIEDTLRPLSETMNGLGLDSAQAFIDGLKSKEQALLEVAQAIADKMAEKIRDGIAAAVAAANAAIPGSGNDVPGGKKPGKGDKPGKGGKPGKGRRAYGGPVAAGMPYLVGERGPELFVPKAAGSVMSAQRTQNALGGQQIVVQPGAVTVVAQGANAAEVAREVDRQLQETLRNAARAAATARR